jgi:hypothetical protein
MANTILTTDKILKEALSVLHQKLNLITNLDLQYDSSFKDGGDAGKPGTTLRVRKPPKYTVRTNSPTFSAVDHTETKVDLTLATQSGVDVEFTTKELTMDLNEFSDQFLEPAMSVLGSYIEGQVADGLADAAQNHVLAATNADFADINTARERLDYALAPLSKRCATLSPVHVTGILGDTKGLFQDAAQIKNQYKEGILGRIAGFDFFSNTLIPAHTVGAHGGTPLSNGTAQDGASIITDGWTDENVTLKKGDVITFAGTYAVQDETKATLGHLKQFVVTADNTADSAGNMTIAIAPSIVTSGAYQNVSQGVADGSAVVVSGTASTTYQRSLLFQEGCAAFVTADLEVPGGVHMAGRQVMDGISMRMIRDYDISSDKIPARLDVLWGWATLYPEHACTLML